MQKLNKHKILFVCHGNICRSPMAEFVMKDLVRKAHRENEFYIDSAATSTEEIGNGVHYGTRAKLEQVGVPVGSHHARQVTKQDYKDFDLILLMDQYNRRNIKRILPNDPEGKIQMLLDYTDRADKNIAAPWYTGNFDETYKDVLEGCEGLLAALK